MNDILANLRKLCEEHEKHLSDLRHKINEIDYIPKATALVGKCFKYQENSSMFGFSSRRLKGAYVYKRIIGSDKEYVIVDSFQVNSISKFDISFGDREYVTHFINPALVEISEKQYFKAFNKMIKYIFETGKKEN